MGIVIRQSIKGTVAQYLGVIIGYLNLLYILPYCLSPEENGLFRLILETAAFFAMFAQIGIPNAIPKFWPLFKDSGRSGTLGNYALIAPIFSTLAFILIYYLFFRDGFNGQLAEKSPGFIALEWTLLPIGLLVIYSNILETLISNYYRVTVPKLFREIVLRLGFSLACLLYFQFALSINDFYNLINLSYLLCGALLFIYYLKLRKANRDTLPSKPIQRATWNAIIRFLSILLLTGIGTILVNKIDIFMVSSQIGLTNNAIYTTAFLITMVMEVPARSFQLIMSPIVSDAIFSKNTKKIGWAYKKSSVGQTLVALVILTGVLLNIGWLYNTMPDGDIYRLGIPVIVFLGIAKLFDAVTGINQLILLNSKYYYMSIFFTFGLAFLAIILNNALIPRFQLNGVAIATAVSIFLYNLTLLLFIWKKFNQHPFSRASLHLLYLTGISAVLVGFKLIYLPNSFIFSGLLSALYLGFVVFYCYQFHVLNEINKLIKRLIS